MPKGLNPLLRRRLPRDRGPPGAQRVGQRAERVEVREAVHEPAGRDLFRSEVRKLGLEFLRPHLLQELAAREDLREPQVREFGRVIVRLQQDVSRGDVAVDEPVLVEVIQRYQIGVVVADADILERRRRTERERPPALEALLDRCGVLKERELVVVPAACIVEAAADIRPLVRP